MVVSGEHDARVAALAQVDIQAALPGMQVIMARPVLLNLGQLAEQIFVSPETGTPDPKRFSSSLKDGMSALSTYSKKISTTFDLAPVDIPTQVVQVTAILSRLDWSIIRTAAETIYADQAPATSTISSSSSKTKTSKKPQRRKGTVEVAKERENASVQALGSVFLQLLNHNPIQADIDAGICPLPLYDFSNEEIELVRTGRIDDLQKLLRDHQLLQYFFPPADQLALGIIDRTDTKLSPSRLVGQLAEVPNMGHPFEPSELIGAPVSMPKVIDLLQERGLAVEGELGLEVTEKGQVVRASLKFKPREGLFEKIINKFNFSIDLKNLFGK